MPTTYTHGVAPPHHLQPSSPPHNLQPRSPPHHLQPWCPAYHLLPWCCPCCHLQPPCSNLHQHLQQPCASLLCWSLQCCSCRGFHSPGTDSPLQLWSLLQQRGCPGFLLSFSRKKRISPDNQLPQNNQIPNTKIVTFIKKWKKIKIISNIFNALMYCFNINKENNVFKDALSVC